MRFIPPPSEKHQQRSGPERRPLTSNTVTPVRNYLIVAATYAGLYIALDWISFIHVLPEVGFTLWNPPPALSLALLLTRGFRNIFSCLPTKVMILVLSKVE